MDRESYKSEAKHWSNMPPCTAASGQDSAAIFAIQGRWRLPFIGGIGVQLAHQLPGKPEAGKGSRLVGRHATQEEGVQDLVPFGCEGESEDRGSLRGQSPPSHNQSPWQMLSGR